MGWPTLIWLAHLFAGSLLLSQADAQYYKIDNRENILESSRTLAYDLMLFYKGNQSGEIPGTLPGPPASGNGDYYWWQGGALMGLYIDYWHLTGDASYNSVVMQGMLHQVGENQDYMPSNHTSSLGNDDQAFWGMSAMLAAETRFPNPPDDKPQWLALAQAVWNRQADPSRHDQYCSGGLRWQIFFSNNGYDYKNTIANAGFFNLGARLARYTDNATYAEYAEKTWDWLWGVNYIDHSNWRVYDGGHVEKNCTDINKATYSYNAAALLQGAASMYNYTNGSQVWQDRVDKLSTSLIDLFFSKGAAFEIPCEGRKGACSPDMLSFKGYVHRWLSVVTQIAPFTRDKILPVLRKSAEAAVRQCTGGSSGRACGFYWTSGQYVDPAVDKTSGAGEAMDALSAVASLLIDDANSPVTNLTGGTSKGNPAAGLGHTDNPGALRPITAADRVGAGILTFVVLGSAVSTFGWMCAFD